jgi:hypothetical protein
VTVVPAVGRALSGARVLASAHQHPRMSFVVRADLHFFFEMSAEPPFAVLRTSKTWRIAAAAATGSSPPASTTTKRGPTVSSVAARPSESDPTLGSHTVQYVAGAYYDSSSARMVLTYGVGDHSGMVTSIRIQQVFRMLAEVGTTQYAACLATRRQIQTPGRRDYAFIGVCEDAACQPVDGVVLALCPTLCSHYPYSCDGAAELSQRLAERGNATNPAAMAERVNIARSFAGLAEAATASGVGLQGEFGSGTLTPMLKRAPREQT